MNHFLQGQGPAMQAHQQQTSQVKNKTSGNYGVI